MYLLLATCLPCGTEESPTLPPHCITAEGVWFKIAMRKGGRVENSSVRVQPEATASTKHLFFLDVGRGLRPPEISIQFHMVSLYLIKATFK